jgi:YjbE family integral membrane protein
VDLQAIVASFDWLIFSQTMFANIILSGDNAVLIGLAASGLPEAQRARAIMFGMVAAAVLRVVFSVFALYLLEIPGLLLVGGLLLLWIAWGFLRDLRAEDKEAEAGHGGGPAHHSTFGQALRTIIIADVSMSLDNVLAIAGIARGNLPMLIVGLAVSILLMGLAATLIAKLLDRFRWIAYAGVALIAWIGIEMTWEGAHQLLGWFRGEGIHHGALQQRPALVVAAPGAPAAHQPPLG